MRLPSLPVVIVGAGPTGVAAANLLARSGVASVVLDRHRAPYPRPRAVHLDGEAVRILQWIGVDEEFRRISRPAAGLRLLDGRLRPFAEFRYDSALGTDGHPEANLFDQPDLEALLRRNLGAATLRGGMVVTGVDTAADDPVVTVRDLATGGCERITAAAVLGCDGADSTVRDAIGSRWLDLGFAERWFVVDVRCRRPVASWGGVDQVCDPRRAATFMHLRGDRYRWEFRMHPGERGADLAHPDRVAALTTRWLGDVPRDEWEVWRSAEYTFRAAVADRWRDGRVLLLGDAAHLTPPFIGQGLGAGLRDAHNLSWKLAAVLRGEQPPDLLDTYQAERAPHVTTVIRTAVRVGRAMTGGHGLAAALRRPVARAVVRLPGAQARALAGITARYPPGPFVHRRVRRRDLAGSRCPQPFVRSDGRRARLDELLGDGFALLRAGPVDDGLLRQAQALGARTLRIHPAAGPPAGSPVDTVVEDDGTLRRWLQTGRATAVLLRPDRFVMAAA